MHLDSPVVSSGIPVTLPKTNWLKKFLSTKNASRSGLQRYPVGSRYKYIPNDKAEVSCNTHLDKIATKPKKSLFNQSSLNASVRRWILSPERNLSV